MVKELVEELLKVNDPNKIVYLEDWNEQWAKPWEGFSVTEVEEGVYLG